MMKRKSFYKIHVKVFGYGINTTFTQFKAKVEMAIELA